MSIFLEQLRAARETATPTPWRFSEGARGVIGGTNSVLEYTPGVFKQPADRDLIFLLVNNAAKLERLIEANHNYVIADDEAERDATFDSLAACEDADRDLRDALAALDGEET